MVEVNQENLELLFYWINERHRIFLLKEAGEPKPWTQDPHLQRWKFCNPFRVNDRQTRNLIDYVINPHLEDAPDQMLFNIYLFRAFNLLETYDVIGWQYAWHLKSGEAYKRLLYHMEKGNQLTSGAYMIRGREGITKAASIFLTLSNIWEGRFDVIEGISQNLTMENAYQTMMKQGFWGWGPFTTYQVLLDLTYTPILKDPVDINDWCIFGPGAGRGLNLIWPGIKRSEYLTAAKNLYKVQGKYREEHVPEMTLQDIEFSLCELQKYVRLKKGGKSKERYNGTN